MCAIGSKLPLISMVGDHGDGHEYHSKGFIYIYKYTYISIISGFPYSRRDDHSPPQKKKKTCLTLAHAIFAGSKLVNDSEFALVGHQFGC